MAVTEKPVEYASNFTPFDTVEVVPGYIQEISDPADDPDGISYEVMRHHDAELMCDELVRQIKESGEQFDDIISLRRGGLFVGNYLAKALGMEDRHYQMGIKLYTGIHANQEALKNVGETYRQVPLPLDLQGKKILLVDDVDHTSKTLLLAKQALEDRGAVVSIAVLHQKTAFKSPQIHADFVVRDTSNWIPYPWEHQEYLDLDHQFGEFFDLRLRDFLIKHMTTQGKVRRFLHRLGFASLYTPDLTVLIPYFLKFGFRSEELPTPQDVQFLDDLRLHLEKDFTEKFGYAPKPEWIEAIFSEFMKLGECEVGERE